jgi:hypothetical protein
MAVSVVYRLVSHLARPKNARIWEGWCDARDEKGSLVTLAFFFAFAKLDPANLAAHGLG